MSRCYRGKYTVFDYPNEWEIQDNDPKNIIGENCYSCGAVKLGKLSPKALLWVISLETSESLGYHINKMLKIIESPYIIGKTTYTILKTYTKIAEIKGFRIEAISILCDDSVEEYILIIFVDNGIFHEILLSASSDSILDVDGSNMIDIKKDMEFIVNSIKIPY
jgi:hypothetical protein